VNTLSKVFVIVNVVFAIAFCFMTLTLYAKRVDFKDKWRQEEDKHRRTKDDMQAKLDDRDTKITALDKALDQARSHVRELTEHNAELQENLLETKDKYFETNKERTLLMERTEAMRAELQRRHDDIDRMHRIILKQQQALEVAKANLRNAMNQRMEMENELNNTRQQLVAVQKEKARLERDLHHHSWIIDTLIEHGVPVQDLVFGSEREPTEPVEGKVLAVRPDVNLVMLSVGDDDGVKPGYTFTVYRSDRYVGKVKVEKVFSDMSSAKILTEYTKDEIRENDDAATRVF
jgi:hypothetical protein